MERRIRFTGTVRLGPVDFLVVSEAREKLRDPDLDGIDGDHWPDLRRVGGDIHSIALRDVVKGLGG